MTNKKKLLAFSALAILLTSGFPVIAHAEDDGTSDSPMGDERPMKLDDESRGFGDGPRGKDRKGGPDGGNHGAEMFTKTDKNGDGFLTKDEMLDAHKARLDEMFAKADKDGDNKLSRDEMRSAHEAMREKFREKFKDRMKNMREQREGMREKYGNNGGNGEGRGRFRDDGSDSGSDE